MITLVVLVGGLMTFVGDGSREASGEAVMATCSALQSLMRASKASEVG